MKDVAVIIAAWNAQDFIGAAVRSALAQEGVTVQVIVSDDASSDDTLEAAQAAAEGDPALVCVRLERNSGPSGARNAALEKVDARFVAVLDADDTMTPDRLARMVADAEATEADIVLDNMRRVDADGAPIGGLFLTGEPASRAQDVSLAAYMDPKTTEVFGQGLGFLKPLFRTETLKRQGAQYDVSLRNSEDYFFVAYLIAGGARARYIPEAGYVYTVQEGSLSHRLSPKLTGAIRAAELVFRDKYYQALSVEERAAANRRLVRIEQFDAVERFVDALKRRRPGEAVATLVSNWRRAPYCLSRMAGIALNKAFGRTDAKER